MTTRREMEMLYDMITVNAARAMNVKDHELKVGGKANLVMLTRSDVLEALREHSAPKVVISRGKVVNLKEKRF
jgi:cytosine deaminase